MDAQDRTSGLASLEFFSGQPMTDQEFEGGR